jgi:hypothetical protein
MPRDRPTWLRRLRGPWPAITALATLLAAACGTTGRPAVLPADVKIVAPGPDVPRPLAALSGTWTGEWGAVRTSIGDETVLAPATWPVPAILAVERIEGRRAWLVYAWGATADVPREGSERVVGTVGPDGALRALLANGAELEYRLSADGRTLAGTHRLRGVPMFGEFKRRP